MESEPYEQVLLTLYFATPGDLPSVGLTVAILIVILLLMCSALVSGSEVAYFSLSAGDMESLSEEDSPSSNRLLELKDHPKTLLATILIANNFINIGIVLISDYILRQVLSEGTRKSWANDIIDILALGDLFSPLGLANLINFLIAVLAVTFLLIW